MFNSSKQLFYYCSCRFSYYNKENNTFETERELMYVVDGKTYKPDTYYTVKDGLVQETDVRDKF